MSAPWQAVSALFERIVELPAAERAGALAAAAAADPAVAAEVAELLAAHDASSGFLDEPPRDAAAEVIAAADEESPGVEHLGPYRLGRRLGRGGTGSVYLATREDQEFHRRVAIKVIRRGMATPEVVRRFRGERQILASIDHPSIARLLDGGSTPDGLPYLVMEYVEGEPIDRYCDARSLPIAARLSLLRQVCGAVRVAHQNLVVHRDLKPANILVTADGTPKLLDFGIAKLLNPELGGGDQATSAELLLGTPDFASPEQITGAPITTASDVYALGVLLYLLLCGRRPRPAARTTTAEELRRDPAPPSAAIAVGALAGPDEARAVAHRRSSTPARLARRLRGDLDAIALRALRWEPALRYASVEQLDDDLGRALAGLPVRARNPTFAYRTGKLLGRHRVAAAASFTAVAFAAALLLNHFAGERRVAAANEVARAETAKVAAVNGFLREILNAADPETGQGASLTVVEAVRAAVPRIGTAFAGQPGVEAAVRHDIGRTLLRLGQVDEAEEQIAASLQLRERVYGADSLEAAASLNSLGEARYDHGDLASAGRHFERALTLRRRFLGEDHPDVAETLDDIGNLHHDQNDIDGAETYYRQALAIRRRHDPVSGDVASSLNNLAFVQQDRGDIEGAEALYRESLAIGRRALGESHPAIASTLNNLATLLQDRGDLAGAETLFRQSVAITRERQGARSPELALNLENLGFLLQQRRSLPEAEALFLEALGILRQSPGADDAEAADVLEKLGTLEEDRSRWPTAAKRFHEALEQRRRLRPLEPSAIAWDVAAEAHALAREQHTPQRETAMRNAFEALRSTSGAAPEEVADLATRLAALYESWGDAREAAAFDRLAETLSASSAPTSEPPPSRITPSRPAANDAGPPPKHSSRLKRFSPPPE